MEKIYLNYLYQKFLKEVFWRTYISILENELNIDRNKKEGEKESESERDEEKDADIF